MANDLYYLYINFTKPSEKLIFTYSRSAADGTKRQASYILGKIRRIFPALTVIEGGQENDVKTSLGTDRGFEFLIEGIQKQWYAEGEEKERWWEVWRYYAKRDEGKWLREALRVHMESKRTPKLSKEALETLYGDELRESITPVGNVCPLSIFVFSHVRTAAA